LKLTELIKLSFNKKLIAAIMVILFLSTASVGTVGYLIARESLDKKGETILKNSVVQAIQLIDTNYELFKSGVLTEEQAQEKIREMLHGNKNEDGTRKLTTDINIGENGYIMIVDQFGKMFMHPTLEGEQVLDVVDYGDEDHYLVKEQIEKALNGGGYVTYYWVYPHSENIGKKISYSMFYPKWKWIVTATSYKTDFNAEANKILVYITMFILGIFFITSILIIRYVINVTKPIIKLSRGMEKIGYGEYELIDIKTYTDEVGLLVNGYNKMVNSLVEAEQNILIQTKRLHYLAYNDELTNMPNRHGFKSYVTERLEQCY
jgi:methyl-accepting chemotaxis protein